MTIGASGLEQSTQNGTQQAIARRVEHMLMAPCCYAQTIDVHESDIAKTMRAEVVQMIAAGTPETAIYDHYKATYGEQILAVPDGSLGRIAFATQYSVTAGAIGLLGFVLWKFHSRKSLLAHPAASPEFSPEEQAIRHTIRQETERW